MSMYRVYSMSVYISGVSLPRVVTTFVDFMVKFQFTSEPV